MSEAAYPITIDRIRLRMAKAVFLLVMLVSVVHAAVYVTMALPVDTGFSRLGLRAGMTLDHSYTRVERIGRDSPAAKAGIQAGDWVRFDRPTALYRLNVPPGERFGVSVRTEIGVRHVILIAPPSRIAPMNWAGLMSGVTNALLTLAGGVIAIRSVRLSGVILGGALASMGMLGTYTYLWENHPVMQMPLTVLFTLIMSGGPVLLLLFAILMRREAFGRPVSAIWKSVFWTYGGLQAAITVASLYVIASFQNLPLVADGFLATVLLQWGGFALALGVLFLGWREAVGTERTRFGFLFLALALLFLAGNGVGLFINLTGNDFSLKNPVAVSGHAFMLAGIAAFLYASLRHKIIDLGFAVNRTLVYGVLSTLMLVVFWFLEWGIEEIIPAETREANVLISAGIALAIFLVFHHVRDWVEKGIEHTFFRAWRDNEARLNRFLKDAAYITKGDNLAAASVAEFQRFAGGAPVALYAVDEDGATRREGGLPGLAHRLPADAPALVRLRADREPLDGGPATAIGATLILPMVQRSQVTGFFVLGAKPSASDYRPDEQAALAEAAQKIGFDLRALEIERLERQVQTLSSRPDPAAALALA